MKALHENLKEFISRERNFFKSDTHKIVWEDVDWDCSSWIFHKGASNSITFRELGTVRRKTLAPLPSPYDDFCKAIIVNVKRSKNVGFVSLHKYLIECRRLYQVMKERNETTPWQLTRWHFERTLELLNQSGYKNLYDATASLKVIADIIDKNRLTENLLQFNPNLKPVNSRHDYTPLSELDSDESRKGDEKLPSYEAMSAYATCTNSPINDNEEILLRTIDLLIVMGQRGNEVTLIPFDCWVERELKSRDGKIILDGNNKPIIKTGIRYFAEKMSQDKVHWLADQDIPLAKRAVERLKSLTKNIRATAVWQENNRSRLWNIDPESTIVDDFILTKISFACHYNLHLFLARNGIQPVKFDYDKTRINEKGPERYYRMHFYKAGDVESVIMNKFFESHEQLKVKVGREWRVVLTTSQLLSIKSLGAFQFKERGDYKIDLVINKVTIKDINSALGAYEGLESIFERRKLKEADGSKIVLTSHMPRHWRNTLYELAGMSNVQQALAMGRQKLDQNPTYQHTSLLERTQAHREYLSFGTAKERIQFLHNGIREQKILGEITTLYHKIKDNKGLESAETFLKTHGTAIHLTPFGGCTHDFSQAPCPKHLQCWNGCGHLHRTSTPGETERIQEQISLSKVALKSMEADSNGEFGADVWINDLKVKIENMEKALDIKPLKTPVKVFPEGKQVTIAFEERKGSSVSE